MFDSKSVKSMFANIIENYLSPKQLYHESTIDNTVDIFQQFTPYCQTISTALFYVNNTVGTPSSLVVTLCSSSMTAIKAVTIDPVIGWNTIAFNKEIISKSPYYLKFSSMPVTDYCGLGASTVKTQQFIKAYDENTIELSENLAFQITRGTIVYMVYPNPEVGNYSYPIVAVDVIGRPRVNYRYLDRKIWEEFITVEVSAYSKYPDELDEILRYAESALAEYTTITFYDNRSITNIFVITPSGYSGISRWRENILTRNITFNCRAFIKNTIG